MPGRSIFILITIILVLSVSCTRKTHPATGTGAWLDYGATSGSINKKSEVTNTKAVTRKTISKNDTPIPNVIIVSDHAARKSIDGRYYYDVNGHRYWRNKFDGKYYLFNKSMYNEEAFKPNKE
jgi:hypothetical protein